MTRAANRLDSLLGAPSFRGEVVRSRNGVFTNADGLDPLETSVESLASAGGTDDPCAQLRHDRLRGRRRCSGCGRTRNEIEIDEGGR